MKTIKIGYLLMMMVIMISFAACSSWSKAEKGAAVGAGTGGAMGAVIGKASGNTALGAIIGATAGGAAGAVIGNQMDKQAEAIRANVTDATVIRVGEGIVVEFNSKVLFGFDQSLLSNDAKANLNQLVNVLKNNPDTNIEVQGHTDDRGSVAYNQTLSEKRAQEVAIYLVERGVSAKRLKTQGFGKMLPKYFNDTQAGRDLNRRVEFIISANDKMKADAEKQSRN